MTLRFFAPLVLFITSSINVISQSFTGLEKRFTNAVAIDDIKNILEIGTPYLKGLMSKGDSVKSSIACYEISSAAYFSDDFRTSISYSLIGIQLLPARKRYDIRFKHVSTIAEAYNNIALDDSSAWWFAECGNLLNRYPQLEEELRPYVKAFYNNIGAFYLRKKDIQNANLYLKKAHQLAEKMKDKRAIGIAVNSLGNMHNQIGDYVKAEGYYLKALYYFPKEQIDRCWIYHSLGSNANLDKRYSDGLAYQKKGIALYRSLQKKDSGNNRPQLQMWQMVQLGKSYLGIGSLREAEKTYNYLIRELVQKQIRHSEELSAALIGAGIVSEAKGEFHSALRYYQSAVISASKSFTDTSVIQNPSAEQAISGRCLFDALTAKAECFEKIHNVSGRLQPLTHAANAHTAALVIAKRMRKEMNGFDSKIFFSDNTRPVFDKAIRIVYRLYHETHQKEWLEKLIALQESSRNITFSDALHESLIKPISLGKEVLEEERLLNQKIIKVKKELVSAVNSGNKKQTEMALDDLLIKKQRMLEKIDIVNPSYRKLKYEDVDFSITNLQRKLGDHTAYLAYYASSDFLYATLILHDQVKVSRQKLDLSFEKNIRTLRIGVQTNPEMFAFRAVGESAWLYNLLLAPFLSQLSGICDRLIIARDGELNTIPFEILTKNGRYLFEDFAISYAYSAETVGLGIAKRGYAGNTIGFAPFTASNEILIREKGFKVLENSEHEIFETSDFCFSGLEASKAAFLKVIPQASILHLATHANYNDSVPENSYISFFPFYDHQLPANEIMNLPLSDIRLTILSVCDGGRSRMHNGDGLISLSRAFGLAGCPAVVTSMWAANDTATDFIVTAFYKHLRNGLSGDYALREAKKDFLKSPLAKIWNHPFYWANMTYIGDNSPVFPEPFYASREWTLFALLSILLICVLLFRHFFVTKAANATISSSALKG